MLSERLQTCGVAESAASGPAVDDVWLLWVADGKEGSAQEDAGRDG